MVKLACTLSPLFPRARNHPPPPFRGTQPNTQRPRIRNCPRLHQFRPAPLPERGSSFGIEATPKSSTHTCLVPFWSCRVRSGAASNAINECPPLLLVGMSETTSALHSPCPFCSPFFGAEWWSRIRLFFSPTLACDAHVGCYSLGEVSLGFILRDLRYSRGPSPP